MDIVVCDSNLFLYRLIEKKLSLSRKVKLRPTVRNGIKAFISVANPIFGVALK